MLDTPQIARTAEQLTAVTRLTVPREEIRNVMGPGIREVMAAVAAQGIAPTGPWFTYHLRMDPAVFDFEVGVPVGAPVAAAGRVRAGHLPAATVARTVYHGPYEGLAGAWGEFEAWITPPTATRRRRTSGNATSSARRRPPTPPAGAPSSTGRCAPKP